MPEGIGYVGGAKSQFVLQKSEARAPAPRRPAATEDSVSISSDAIQLANRDDQKTESLLNKDEAKREAAREQANAERSSGSRSGQKLSLFA